MAFVLAAEAGHFTAIYRHETDESHQFLGQLMLHFVTPNMCSLFSV